MRNAIRVLALLTAFLLAAEAVLAAADRTQTVGGTISRLDAARQTLVVKVGEEEMRFVWNEETRINGVLAPGARVTVRYAAQPDGQNLAHQISVGR
ncbi:MAG: DUF5666 domain-containing protein [Thermoanaerobaculia bacterium]